MLICEDYHDEQMCKNHKPHRTFFYNTKANGKIVFVESDVNFKDGLQKCINAGLY